MEVMGRPERHHLSQGQAHQSQIANQIEQFVAHRLIGKAQRRVHPLIAITHQGVIQGAALN